jgi:hypothetical protein
MSSVFVLFRYHTENETYRYLHEIRLTEIETENILRYGTQIMYVETVDVIDIIQLFTSRPTTIRTIQIEENDYDSDLDSGSENEIYYDDLINEIQSYAEMNIHIMWIDRDHWNCNFRSICGCGCDDLHDGWVDEYCNPYPRDAYTFSNDLVQYEDDYFD